MFKPSLVSSAIVTALLAPFITHAGNNLSTGMQTSVKKANIDETVNLHMVELVNPESTTRFSDNTLVASLSRLSGVQTVDHPNSLSTRLTIRGYGDFHTSINGRDIYAANGKSIELAYIPMNQLSHVSLSKTRSASQSETGLAASLNFNTYRPLDFAGQTLVVSGQAEYQESAEETNPSLNVLYSNRWQLGSGEMGALINVSHTKNSQRRDSVIVGPASPVNNNWRYDKVNVWDWSDDLKDNPEAYFIGRSAIIGDSTYSSFDTPSANLSIQWAINDSIELLLEGFYLGQQAEVEASRFLLETEQGNFVTSARAPQQPNLYSGSNFIQQRQIIDPSASVLGLGHTQKSDFSLIAFAVNWQINDNFLIENELVAQQGTQTRNSASQRLGSEFYQLDVNFNNVHGMPSILLVDNPESLTIDESNFAAIDNWQLSSLTDSALRQQNKVTTVTSKAKWKFDSFIKQIQFGIKLQQSEIEELSYDHSANYFNEAILSASTLNLTENYLDGELSGIESFISPDGLFLFSNIDAIRDEFDFETPVLSPVYRVEKSHQAAYLTANYSLGQLTGEAGVRYVNYAQDLYFLTTGESTASELLPSFALNWQLNADIQAKIIYSKTLKMPEFSDLNPTIYYSSPLTDGVSYGTGYGGNPDLKPTTATNIDIAVEWQFSQDDALYASVFKRSISDAVTQGIRMQTHTGDDGVERGYLLSGPTNYGESKVNGLELGVTWFSDLVDGVAIEANYTKLDTTSVTNLSDSSVDIRDSKPNPLTGVAESSFNLIAYYQSSAFEARLAYSQQEDSFLSRESSYYFGSTQVWTNPKQRLDFRVNYHINQNITVSFAANNILQENVQTRYGKEAAVWNNQSTISTSRSFALGVSFNY
ncbi:TonB-dependent receptor [Catenovulum agarivorans]|uniref:TonB-dependent receptor n=1 Tax=Catenovulum agarivorans TaxID=1172192 RepID=UPI00037A2999|nr:TonB-dependent receptor [Catenovulum agarivorans]